MKKIFADSNDDDWYVIFLDLSSVFSKSAFVTFSYEFFEELADILIINSFDELCDIEEVFSAHLKERSDKGDPVVFIIKTYSGRPKKNCVKFIECFPGLLYLCDSLIVYKLILAMLPPLEIERETFLADKPKLICPFDLRMHFTMQWTYLHPIFDDDQ